MTGVAYESAYANTQSITTTEHSLPNDATFSTGITNPGKFRTKILVPSAAVAADTFRVKGYAEVNGQTIAAMWDFIIAGNGTAYVVDCPDVESAEDWDVTIIKLTGTDRTFHWTISEMSAATAVVTTVPNTIALDAGGTLTIGATGATVINTGTVAVGDKTSFTLSAGGVTAVQSGLALSTQVDTLEGFFVGGTFSAGAGGTLTLGATGVTVVPASLALNASFPANFSTTFPEVYARLHLDAGNALTETKSTTTFASGIILTRTITNEGAATQEVATLRSGP